MNWIDSHSRVNEGCHRWELQNLSFVFYKRFGTASNFSTGPSKCTSSVFSCVHPSRNENQP